MPLKPVAFDQDTGIPTAWEDDGGTYIPDQSGLNAYQEPEWKESVAENVEQYDPEQAQEIRNTITPYEEYQRKQDEREAEQRYITPDQALANQRQQQQQDFSVFNPWTGDFINEQGQGSMQVYEKPTELKPTQQLVSNYSAPQADVSTQYNPDNVMIGDGGYVIDYNNQQTVGQAPDIQYIIEEVEEERRKQNETNSLYNYWGAPVQYGYNEPIIGDGGYIFAPTGGPGDAREVARPAETYTGDAAIDKIHKNATASGYEWSGQKRTMEEMQRPYTDVYTARWYATDSGLVPEENRAAMLAYLDQIEKNTGSVDTPVSKAELAKLFGFGRYEDGGMVSLSNRLSDFSDALTNVEGNLAQARQDNIHYTGTDSQGRNYDLDAKSDGEILDNLVYKTVSSDGQELDMNAAINIQGNDLYWGDVRLGDWHLLQQVPGYEAMTPEQQEQVIMNVYGIRSTVSSYLNGNELNEDDIKSLTRDPNVLMQLPSVQMDMSLTYDDYLDMDDDKKKQLVNTLIDEYGNNLDYGFLNWNTPQTHRSQNITDNIVNGNLVNQFTDLMLGSAPYLTPVTLVPTAAAQTWQEANGVSSMGRNNQSLDTVANTFTATPTHVLASAGEAYLGGAAAGRLGMSEGFNGVFETIGKKVAPSLANSKNPLVSVAREGLYEGLEEVATNPLYNIEDQGAFDENGNFRLTNPEFLLDDFWNNLAGGALIGAPMEAMNQAKNARR